MSGNRDLILAGVAGGGTGNALCYFAPAGTAGPTIATTPPAAAFLDAGWITEDGLTHAVAESSTDIRAFGSLAPVRTMTTESTVTFATTFLESNPVSLAVYHRKPLTELVPGVGGVLNFETGASESVQYAAVFDMVDGVNHLRAFCPSVQVTDRGDLAITAGEAVTYPVTLTAYPDTDGNAIYWLYVLDALAV